MLKVAEEQDLATVVETAVKKHGAHADEFIPILLEINHEYGYIPGEAIRMARKLLHQPEDHILVSEGRLYGVCAQLPGECDQRRAAAGTSYRCRKMHSVRHLRTSL